MEEAVRKLLRCLKIEYAVFWLLTMLAVALYELDVLYQGVLVGDVRTTYMLEVLGILLTVCLIPFSLRLFSLSLVRCVQQRTLMDAMASYRRWSEIRLALLLVPTLVNLSIYFWTLDTTGLFCAAMALVASLFCVPGKKRLEDELNLQPEDISILNDVNASRDMNASQQTDKFLNKEEV